MRKIRRHIAPSLAVVVVFACTGADHAADDDGTTASATSGGGHGVGGGGQGGDATSTGTAGAGGGAPSACSPADEQPCYDGPSDTEGVGLCQAGVQICGSDGLWGACRGQITPAAEDCQTVQSEACDGLLHGCGEEVWILAATGYRVKSVAADATTGGAWVSGCYAGNFDFGMGASGSNAFYVVKIDSSGTPLFALSIKDGCNLAGLPLAAAPGGGVVMAAAFSNSLQAAGCSLTGAPADIAILELDTAGNCTWATALGGGSQVTDVAVDASGNVAVTGEATAALDFGSGPQPVSGDGDGFVAFLDSAGAVKWGRLFGGNTTDDEWSTSVGFHASSHLVVAGFVESAADFGGGVLPGGFLHGIYTVELDAQGNHVWSKRFNLSTNTGDVSYHLATGPAGATVLFGEFASPLTVDGNVLQPSAGVTGDLFLVRMQSATVTWTKSFGATGFLAGRDVAVDASGNVLIAGGIPAPVDFGGGALAVGQGSNFRDPFLAKLDSAGNHLWSHSAPCGANQKDLVGAAFLPGGHAVIAGEFAKHGCVDFGSGPLTSGDVFVARIAP